MSKLGKAAEPDRPVRWGWVLGEVDDRGQFHYVLHDVAEHAPEPGQWRGDLHVIQNGVTLCGRAASNAPSQPLVICTCDGCGYALAERGLAFRVPVRIARHTMRAYAEMYVFPEQRRAERRMERLAGR